MKELLLLAMEQWQQQSLLEVFGFFTAVAYVWLAANENKLCWIVGLFSTTCYTLVYWQVELVFQMLLNAYYTLIALLGFIVWNSRGQTRVSISRMTVNQHYLVVFLGFFISLLVYKVSQIWLNYELIFLDISVTVFSLLTTWLTIIKKIETWWYWTVINLASMFLYFENELYVTTLLMAVYITIAMKGLYQWSIKLNEKHG